VTGDCRGAALPGSGVGSASTCPATADIPGIAKIGDGDWELGARLASFPFSAAEGAGGRGGSAVAVLIGGSGPVLGGGTFEPGGVGAGGMAAAGFTGGSNDAVPIGPGGVGESFCTPGGSAFSAWTDWARSRARISGRYCIELLSAKSPTFPNRDLRFRLEVMAGSSTGLDERFSFGIN
jgi:hypothetical protein